MGLFTRLFGLAEVKNEQAAEKIRKNNNYEFAEKNLKEMKEGYKTFISAFVKERRAYDSMLSTLKQKEEVLKNLEADATKRKEAMKQPSTDAELRKLKDLQTKCVLSIKSVTKEINNLKTQSDRLEASISKHDMQNVTMKNKIQEMETSLNILKVTKDCSDALSTVDGNIVDTSDFKKFEDDVEQQVQERDLMNDTYTNDDVIVSDEDREKYF